MADEVALHIVPKSTLANGTWPADWQDGGNILEISSRIHRMLLSNPLSSADDDPVMAVATVGDAVAGRICLMPSEIRVRGDAVPALGGFDLLVSPDFRGKGIATKVVAAWRDCWDAAIGNYVNAPSAPIYPKLGWTLFETPRFHLILRSRRFVDGFVPVGAAASPVSGVVDVALAARRRLSGHWPAGRTGGLRAERAMQMSPEYDPQLAKQRAPLMCHRSAAWVNWALGCPDPEERDRHRLYYVRDADDHVVGFFMLALRHAEVLAQRFREVEIGTVKEWMIFDPDQLDPLTIVLLGLRELDACQADVVMIASSGLGEEDLRSLRRLGFRTRDPLLHCFFAHPSSPLGTEECWRQESWHLSDADSDGFFL